MSYILIVIKTSQVKKSLLVLQVGWRSKLNWKLF